VAARPKVATVWIVICPRRRGYSRRSLGGDAAQADGENGFVPGEDVGVAGLAREASGHG